MLARADLEAAAVKTRRDSMVSDRASFANSKNMPATKINSCSVVCRRLGVGQGGS